MICRTFGPSDLRTRTSGFSVEVDNRHFFEEHGDRSFRLWRLVVDEGEARDVERRAIVGAGWPAVRQQGRKGRGPVVVRDESHAVFDTRRQRGHRFNRETAKADVAHAHREVVFEQVAGQTAGGGESRVLAAFDRRR